MKESDILDLLRQTVLQATPDGTEVRTKGGDEDLTFPRVLLDWRTRRERDQGANPFAGFEYNGKFVDAAIYHYYFSFHLTLEFKSEDEEEVYDLGDAVQRAFMQYEDSPNSFHPHTYLWEVGEVRPQRNPVMEPDWYETVCQLRFRFLKERRDSDISTLEEIQHDINPY